MLHTGGWFAVVRHVYFLRLSSQAGALRRSRSRFRRSLPSRSSSSGTRRPRYPFGDVAHISPWRIRRRFPRSASDRGGQLVTIKDALLAVNELIAKDEEMPERTFKMSGDGMLASVCDIPIAKKSATGDVVEIRVSIDGAAPVPITAHLLEEHLCDFKTVAFVRWGKGLPAGDAKGKVETAADAGAGGAPKTGDTKVMTLPGGAKIEMIWCGPGKFMIPVSLTKGFWLGKYEITQTQWESVMGENHSRFKGADRPADNLSWDDCQRFVNKVNAAFGGRARMPTEAEWEYACRAGSDTPVSGSGHLSDMAWYDANSGSQTHVVGENQANHWGFYDMHGNVLEWCSDWFSKPEGRGTCGRPEGAGIRRFQGASWRMLVLLRARLPLRISPEA